MTNEIRKPKTNEEIIQLANDTIDGKIFGSWMVHENDMHLLSSIFMILVFCTDFPKEAKHVYEYMDKAGDHSINGYPMFMSLGWLDADECNRLQTALTMIKEQRDSMNQSILEKMNNGNS